MFKVFKNRGEGKTTELLLKSAETGIPVLLSNPASASYAEGLVHKMNLCVPTPLTLVPEDNLTGKKTEVYLDDADCLIKKLFEDAYPGLKLAGYAMSMND